MAKSFYTATEAAAKLGKSEDELKVMARDGVLREFRDAGSVNYKVEEIDRLAATTRKPAAPPPPAAEASDSAEILLEPVEDSGVELSPSGSDVLSLDESGPQTIGDTSAGTKPGTRKEDTAVPSVGINLFDDAELDESVDPLAQTAVSDVGGLGLEGSGSGSGILDLTKESDDTSLGAELLDEIYTDEEKPAAGEVGEDTRAGMEGAVTEEAGSEAAREMAEAGMEVGGGAVAGGRAARAVVREVVEYPPDALSTALLSGMIVAVVVFLVGGLGGAALVRETVPALLQVVYSNLAIFSGSALAVAALAVVITFFVVRRSG